MVQTTTEQSDPPTEVMTSAPVVASVRKSTHATSDTLQTFIALVPRFAALKARSPYQTCQLPTISPGPVYPPDLANGNQPAPVNQTRLKSATKREASFFTVDSPRN